jgi:hypothetical protein
MNVVDQLKKLNEAQEKNAARINEEYKKLELVANKVFSTEEGRLLLKAIKSFSGIEVFDVKPNLDSSWLSYSKGRRDVYLMLLRLLNNKVRNDFERID